MPRRRFLGRVAALGAATIVADRARAGEIRQLLGDVTVNGRPASAATEIFPGDDVRTGPGGRIVFAIGSDAFLVRAGANLRLEGGAGAAWVTGFRLLTGALMGVFGAGRNRRIVTPTVTAGIRGTGVYLEAGAAETYFCTCYGRVELTCNTTGARIEVDARDHDANWIRRNPASGRTIQQTAGLRNHSNAELEYLEGLVGRRVPQR